MQRAEGADSCSGSAQAYYSRTTVAGCQQKCDAYPFFLYYPHQAWSKWGRRNFHILLFAGRRQWGTNSLNGRLHCYLMKVLKKGACPLSGRAYDASAIVANAEPAAAGLTKFYDLGEAQRECQKDKLTCKGLYEDAQGAFVQLMYVYTADFKDNEGKEDKDQVGLRLSDDTFAYGGHRGGARLRWPSTASARRG
jgi:hypothetical protein